MPIQKQKMYLYAESDTEAESGIKLSLIPKRFTYYMGDEAVQLEEVVVRYNLSAKLDANTLRKKAIKTLQDRQKEVIAQAYQREQELQGNIDSLLLLTHDKHEVVL